jgi:hypothetical protein
MSRFLAQATVTTSSSYQGRSPSVFIGSFGYPDVRGGPLLIDDSDHPLDWLSRNLGIEDIVSIRARTIRGSSAVHRFSDNLQEIALSARPLDVDVSFEKPVSFAMTFDGTIAPVGLCGPVRKMDVLGSAHIERAVDRVTSDPDMPAADACVQLGREDVDVYRITRLMTAGLLGKRRHFVPTRWAITAVDDMLSSALKKEIARYPPLDECRVFFGEIFGNRIAAILVPGDWRYEMIEIWGRHTLWAGNTEAIVQDREGREKKGYSPIMGAYYSARLAACEYLSSIRRSARVVLIRHITSDYWAPLGTWVIREAARKVMTSPCISCPSLDDASSHASRLLGFGYWLEHSTLIPEMRTQRTLLQF